MFWFYVGVWNYLFEVLCACLGIIAEDLVVGAAPGLEL